MSFCLSEEHINRLYAIAAHLAENPRFMQQLDDLERRRNLMILKDQQPDNPVFYENQENNDPNLVQELELESSSTTLEIPTGIIGKSENRQNSS